LPSSATLENAIDLSSRRPLRDEAYLVLRRAILSGQFKPGERLVERQVSANLGLSRSPIREAFRRLEQERLVIATRQGIVVQGLDSVEVEELYEIRQHLERLIARRAARHFKPEHTLKFESILTDMTAAVEAHDQERSAAAGLCFHRLVADIAGNRRLARLLDSVSEDIQRFRNLNIGLVERATLALEEHRQLLAALAANDEVRAEELMVQHIGRALDYTRHHANP
jgi:DNA-binding GntR family transcriptional regulator